MVDLYKEWGIDSPQVREMIARRYVERIIECVTNLTCSTCTLSRRERMQEIRRILKNPRIDECLRYAKIRSLYTKLALLPIRWKAVWLVWLEAAVITFVKEHNGKLFALLRSHR